MSDKLLLGDNMDTNPDNNVYLTTFLKQIEQLPERKYTNMADAPKELVPLYQATNYITEEYNRLCPIAKSLMIIENRGYQVNVTFPVMLIKDIFGKQTTVSYEIPVPKYMDPRIPGNITVAQEFINETKDLQQYKFTLTFRQDLNNLTETYTNVSNPNNVRRCNLTLGAYVVYQHLIKSGYKLKKISDLEYQFIPPTVLGGNVAEPKAKLQSLNNNIDNHIQEVKRELNIVEKNVVTYNNIKYGKGITYDKLVELISNIENVKRIKTNLLGYLEWKYQQYQNKIIDLQETFVHDADVYKLARLTDAEVKEISPQINNKLILAYLQTASTCLKDKITTLTNMSPEQLQQDYMTALKDPSNGLKTITNVEIINQIVKIISSLVGGYQAFSTGFQNIVITGPAGVGKTTLAFTLAFIFKKLHILCFGTSKVVTRSDLVAAFLGQTAPKTRSLLFSTLEGILFIDEAYQIGGCPKEDQYGMESLVELLNFLDKYVGLSVIIVAGYEKEMDQCFFGRNEGLRRRFPNKYKLQSYSSLQLFHVFLTKILHSLQFDPFTQSSDLVFIYLLIDYFNNSNSFPNMAGDMLILATFFIRNFLYSNQIQSSLLDSMFEYCIRDNTESNCEINIDNFMSYYNSKISQHPDDRRDYSETLEERALKRQR